MSIPIRCEHCGHQYHVNPSLAGKRVKCRQCAKPIRVPAAPATQAAATPAGRAPHRSPMRHVYRAVAFIVIGMFGFTIYLVGRNMGWWGEPPRFSAGPRSRALTPGEQLEHNRAVSQERLGQIGQALRLWAGQHRGNYPSRLIDVYEVADLGTQVILSPFGGNRDTDIAYLHFRSMGVSMPPETVVAYDAAALARDQGAAVLFASGKVQWLPRQELFEQIHQSDQRRMGLLPVDPDHPRDKKQKLATGNDAGRR